MAVERFLLHMYEVDSDDGPDAGTKDAGGVNKTKLPAADQQLQSGGEVMHAPSDRWWLGGLALCRSRQRPQGQAATATCFLPLDREDGATKACAVARGVVLLQCRLCTSNLEFMGADEVPVLQDIPSVDFGSCLWEGWVFEVPQWHWAWSC
jgi:hypothetical protein